MQARGAVYWETEESRNKAMKEIFENTRAMPESSEQESTAVAGEARWRGVASRTTGKGGKNDQIVRDVKAV